MGRERLVDGPGLADEHDANAEFPGGAHGSRDQLVWGVIPAHRVERYGRGVRQSVTSVATACSFRGFGASGSTPSAARSRMVSGVGHGRASW
ncbi:hypothetical protein GCM10010106_28670 [Thermopolyspora flexuosa]|nr:hypothetical protein GCM10010106_28670 [Thermopolyspora flexuosa]